MGHGVQPDQQVRPHAQEVLPGDLLLRGLIQAQQHPQEQAQRIHKVSQQSTMRGHIFYYQQASFVSRVFRCSVVDFNWCFKRWFAKNHIDET